MTERRDWSLGMQCFRTLGVLGLLVMLLMGSPSALWFEGPLVWAPPHVDQGQISRFIVGYAEHYGLEPALLRAVIKVESNFNPRAVSPKGAMGLMQLMPPTSAALNVQDPFDPKENIRAGAEELRRLLDRFNGNVELALAAYHAGEARVRQYLSVPPFRSTELYVRKVLSYYRLFVARQGTRPRLAGQRGTQAPVWPILKVDGNL